MLDAPSNRRIGLVSHHKKTLEMVAWAHASGETLSLHRLCATGTTGNQVGKETGLDNTRLKSRPLGGDLQLGAIIANDELDILIFFHRSAVGDAARCRRQGTHAHLYAQADSCCLQLRNSRLHHFLRAAGAGECYGR